MRKLRSSNLESREHLTVKLTQKLLENRRKGKKDNIAELARKVSMKMAKKNSF